METSYAERVENMNFFDLNATSVFAGIVAVIVVAMFRIHYPFRYQYYCLLFRNNPKWMKKLLQRSFQKNKDHLVGMLDKSSKEILEGDYDQAEHFIVEGLKKSKEFSGSIQLLITHMFYYNLALIFYFRGQYDKSLQMAFNVYQFDQGLNNALALIICNFARMGEIQQAVEALAELKRKRRLKRGLLLPCLAEIEAAKGNHNQAIYLLEKAKRYLDHFSIHLMNRELEKRILELKENNKRTDKISL